MPTRDAIFAYHEANQESGFRDHLGASGIGNECDRAIWYSWRWTTRANHTGRLLRLFDRGHLEEDRFVKVLRSIGATVLDVNPEDGRQWSFRDSTGHFGGSADGVAYGLPEAPKTWAGLEMKTHGDKSFKGIVKDGVQKSKPQHWDQMHVYGELAGLTRFLYIAVNKNDDDIYTEWVHIDKAHSIRVIAKAQRIIGSPVPPARISDDPSWFMCRFCDHHPSCHGDATPERHCRSCLHSSPVADGKWWCARHECELSRAEQEQGCPHQRYIPDLVPGEQTDIDGETVIYLLRSGGQWRDEGPYRED